LSKLYSNVSIISRNEHVTQHEVVNIHLEFKTTKMSLIKIIETEDTIKTNAFVNG